MYIIPYAREEAGPSHEMLTFSVSRQKPVFSDAYGDLPEPLQNLHLSFFDFSLRFKR